MIQIHQAKSEIEKRAGLLLMLSRTEHPSEQTKIANELFESSLKGEVDLNHLYLAYSTEENSVPIAAIYFLIQADRSALIWPPVTLNVDSLVAESAVDELLLHTRKVIQNNGCWIGQILIEPDFHVDRERLTRNEFKHLTDLEFLKVDLSQLNIENSNNNLNQITELQITQYQPHRNEKRFETLLARTYVDSADCPEIAGFRTPQQAFIGHKMSGAIDPAFWRIYSVEGNDVAVLLLNRNAGTNDIEISYIGIVPEERGNGLAIRILSEEMRRQKRAGTGSFSLAVDTRNASAKRLYERLGFEHTTTRSLHAHLMKNSSEKF